MGYMLSATKEWEAGVNAVDAALETGALFTPQVTGTILPNGTKSEDSFTVYREYEDGSQVVLNAGVKAGYYAGSYGSLVNTAEALFPETVTSMKTWDDGKVLVFTQDLGESYTFADGDSVQSHIMYTGSLDSTFSTKAIGFSFRPFCTNQIASGVLQLAQKRTNNHDVMLFSKAQILAESAKRFDAFVKDATMLKGMALGKSDLRILLNQVAPLVTDPEAPTKTVNAADKRREGILYFWEEEVEAFGANAYSFYQAVQSYEFHTRTAGKQEDMKKVRVVAEPEKAQTLTNQALKALVGA